jgi:ribosomal-protein-alanine N-acetyltransferase
MARVLIAPLAPDDSQALIEANLGSRAHHAPWAYPFIDRPGFESWFARTLAGSCVSLVAREQGSGGIVGVVNFSEVVRGGFQNAYLGFYGMAAFAGRGLMTEAVGAGLRHAFGPLGLHRVEANIQPGNLRSKALIQRLNFRREGFSPRYLQIGGEWRDHERYALLADEFQIPFFPPRERG